MVFEKAIQRTAPSDDIKQRVINLTDEITYSVYMYTARGLFEADKLIFLAQVAFQVIPANVCGCCWSTLNVNLCWFMLFSHSCAAAGARWSPAPRPRVPGQR